MDQQPIIQPRRTKLRTLFNKNRKSQAALSHPVVSSDEMTGASASLEHPASPSSQSEICLESRKKNAPLPPPQSRNIDVERQRGKDRRSKKKKAPAPPVPTDQVPYREEISCFDNFEYVSDSNTSTGVDPVSDQNGNDKGVECCNSESNHCISNNNEETMVQSRSKPNAKSEAVIGQQVVDNDDIQTTQNYNKDVTHGANDKKVPETAAVPDQNQNFASNSYVLTEQQMKSYPKFDWESINKEICSKTLDKSHRDMDLAARRMSNIRLKGHKYGDSSLMKVKSFEHEYYARNVIPKTAVKIPPPLDGCPNEADQELMNEYNRLNGMFNEWKRLLQQNNGDEKLLELRKSLTTQCDKVRELCVESESRKDKSLKEFSIDKTDKVVLLSDSCELKRFSDCVNSSAAAAEVDIRGAVYQGEQRTPAKTIIENEEEPITITSDGIDEQRQEATSELSPVLKIREPASSTRGTSQRSRSPAADPRSSLLAEIISFGGAVNLKHSTSTSL